MKKYIILVVFVLLQIGLYAQSQDKTYLRQGYSHDGNGYNVCELIIHSDSSYTFKKYKLENRKSRTEYRNYEPETAYGIIEKVGDFYEHTKIVNDSIPDKQWISQITNKKVILFTEKANGSLKRLEAYKRI
ncbi:hypothetical protein ESY86_06680 [Subsaximicrobium wynnwilliamsii]|uniref:Uncharacterized protein n=1 Tax=Subsaximicrobium wynnwilliamsii TaxID=291179 RepID=A0A5C6ZJZ8_9FLAO|nr:hypothetical protein [Subsaximicrobium wynnwilliamsii]TXD84261.1 hypothetical protein ESY87_07095 [Subsaximicrobium wynnwilliamsii]TXD89882.1 hypothetical protein ESY86_06680 [Subsaximicrobium wynnwilliamsii]TXE03973.1 hypothetical protein ESY88_07090 [Subsaximicrobium wynnwilliamsii]